MSSPSKNKNPMKQAPKPISKSIITTRSAKLKNIPKPKAEQPTDDIISQDIQPKNIPRKPQSNKRIINDNPVSAEPTYITTDIRPRKKTKQNTKTITSSERVRQKQPAIKQEQHISTPHNFSPSSSIIIMEEDRPKKALTRLPSPPTPPPDFRPGKYVWVPDSPSPDDKRIGKRKRTAKNSDNETVHDEGENQIDANHDNDNESIDPNESNMQDVNTPELQWPVVPTVNTDTKVVYMEDLDAIHNPLQQCEIWETFNSDPEYATLMDPEFKPIYAFLPPLKLCSITSWDGTAPSGLIMWSSWKHQLDDPDMELYKEFMDFERDRHFVNPARTGVNIYTTVPDRDGFLTTLTLKNGNPCLCISLVYVAESRLLRSYKTAGGKLLKSIECIFHSYEWERTTSLFCMAFGVDTLQAQLSGGAISIATRPTNITVDTNMSSRALFSDAPSPSKKRMDARNTNKVKIQLNPSDEVPVYDGRKFVIHPNDRALATIGNSLPTLDSEVPTGSLAIVAYTANAYRRQKGSRDLSNLALNINWVVLLSTPK